MNSKKFAALGLALLLTLGMTSCGAPANKGGDTSATESGADKGTSSEKLESADKEISLPTAREVKNMDLSLQRCRQTMRSMQTWSTVW